MDVLHYSVSGPLVGTAAGIGGVVPTPVRARGPRARRPCPHLPAASL